MKNVRWLMLALAVASSSAVACGGDDDGDDSEVDEEDFVNREYDTDLILQELGEICLFRDSSGLGQSAGSTNLRNDDCHSGVCVAASETDAYCSAKCDDEWKQIDCPSGFSCEGAPGFKTCQEL